MANIPGDTLTELVALLDNTNTPVSSATFTTLLTADPDGNEFALAYTEIGSGSYRFTTTTTNASALGEWFALVQANDPMAQVFALQWTLQDEDRPNPWYVGQTLVETVTLLDASGDPVTGANWTITTTHSPQTTSITPTWEELGSGAYRFTVDDDEVTAEGMYYVLVRADDTLTQSFEIEWQVSPTTVITYSTPTNGMTRRDLRRAIMQEIGDLTVTTATAASGSSQWTDVDNLSFGDSGRYAGRELFVTRGTVNNIGQLRAIAGSNGQGTINLMRSLPDSVQIGDEAEIVNTYGGGIRIQQVHDAINTSIIRARVEIPIAATIEGAFDTATRSVTIPPEFVTIHAVQAVYPDDEATHGWRDIRKAQGLGADGWSVERATGTLYIGGYTGTVLADATIRIFGFGHPPPMTSDDDISPVDAEWLIEDVTAKLLLRAIGGARSITPEWERKGFYRDQKANDIRDLVRVRRPPNSVRVN